MAKKETAKDKKVKDLLSQLSSSDTSKQLKAVKSLKIHGNESVIEPLVQVLSSDKSSQDLKDEIAELLNTLKSTKAPEQIIACLNKKEYAASHQLLLASIWNSGLDYRDYLGDIATATVNGDFMSAMECITIIENIDGTLTEDQIMDALLVFKSYLVDSRDEDNSKNELIKEIVLTLQNINDSL